MAGLSDAQLQRFQEQGYLHLQGLLSDADINPLMQELNEVVDRTAAALLAAGELEDDGAGLDPDARLLALTRQSPKPFRAIFSGEPRGPALFNFLRLPQILDVMESLVGPEVFCHPAYRVRPKLPDIPETRRLTVVPWHQDSAYMHAEKDHQLVVTLWIALVDATVENGCLEVIPSAHREILPHRNVHARTYLDIVPDALRSLERVTLPVARGDAILMTNLTPHRSLPNASDHVRWSIDLRYHSADSDAGYPMETGFLARSRAHPEQVVTELEAFEALRAAPTPPPSSAPPPRRVRWPTWRSEQDPRPPE